MAVRTGGSEAVSRATKKIGRADLQEKLRRKIERLQREPLVEFGVPSTAGPLKLKRPLIALPNM
jgi:hypothetical protein